jgi:hypothetical protein
LKIEARVLLNETLRIAIRPDRIGCAAIGVAIAVAGRA